MLSNTKVVLVIGVIANYLRVINCQKDLPPHWPRCYKNDPNINECLLKATDEMRPYLVEGVPEFNIPPLDPFQMGTMTLNQSSNSLNYHAELINVTLRGLNTYKFTRFDFDVPNLRFDCSCDIGVISVTAYYKIKGKVLLLPIEGEGQFYANLTGLHADVVENSNYYTKKGLQYFAKTFLASKITLQNVFFKFEGLFGGNALIEKALEDAFSGNSEEIIEEFIPVLETSVSSIMDNLLENLKSNVPADKLYPIK